MNDMSKLKHIPQSELLKLEEELLQSTKTLHNLKDSLTDCVNNSVVDTALVVSSLHEIWESIVGEEVASHVKIKHIKGEVLYVVADHRAWSTQLKYLTNEIIEKINMELKTQKISSISMSISTQKS